MQLPKQARRRVRRGKVRDEFKLKFHLGLFMSALCYSFYTVFCLSCFSWKQDVTATFA